VFLGYFAVLTQFLYNQSPWLALYLFALAVLLTALLVNANRRDFAPVASLRSAGRQIVFALPVALLLFLFFPRLDAPLWALNLHNAVGITGVSDHMSFGEIGRLSQSGELAFRVNFLDREPPQQQLYWRGLVLWNYDGRDWTPGRPEFSHTDVSFDPASAVNYEITMEPSGQRWLFPLDVPSRADGNLRLNGDMEIRAPGEIEERMVYRLVSHTDYRLATLTRAQRRKGLQLPEDVGPRTRALARAWRDAHPRDDAAVVNEALRHFNQQPFVYTLSPGVATGDPVEHFLFDTRRGFCEHYAGSFTLLMRLAGIPARVVVGYQGGEKNPLGNYYSVRQSDAHAWSEVWLKDKGWVRVDPTAAVAPERIEQSIDIAGSEESGRVMFDVGDAGWLRNLTRNTRWMFDAVELSWHRWVLGFNTEHQQGLMRSLGLAQLGRYAAAAVIAMLLIVSLLVFGLMLGLHTHVPVDPVTRAWRRYQKKLRKGGLEIPPWLGPEQLLLRASSRWPKQKALLTSITRHYVKLRYGKLRGAAPRKQFKRLVGQLRLG
jgi:transglutaminase-like putative cysteine protease